MKPEGRNSTVAFLISLTSLCTFTYQARAWECSPPCSTSACEECEGGVCVYQCDANNCETCEECSCYVCFGGGECTSCQEGECQDDASLCTGERHDGCSEGSCAYNASLCTGECHNGCSAAGTCINDDSKCSTCKECNGGDCVLKPTSECDVDSDCDPSEHCENCNCVCDACWAKKWKAPETHVCPACDGGCPGHYEQKWGYYICAAAGAGEGGQCECNSQEIVLGVRYECDINWDVSMLVECSILTGFCALVCIETMEAPLCSDCLMEAGVECCPAGECGLCDFIEDCEEDTDTAEDLYGWQFVSLEGASCEG